VTDFLADSPVVIPAACPACEPERDARTYDVRWCPAHLPSLDGAADHVVSGSSYLAGGSEAGGEDNRMLCALIHRGARPGDERRCPWCKQDTLRENPVTRRLECALCGASKPSR
jgi:hypothetical protein